MIKQRPMVLAMVIEALDESLNPEKDGKPINAHRNRLLYELGEIRRDIAKEQLHKLMNTEVAKVKFRGKWNSIYRTLNQLRIRQRTVFLENCQFEISSTKYQLVRAF